MKKFYALAAAALATVSMNAQLYVCGKGEGLGWDCLNPMEVELTDGSYTFSVANLVEFKMSTAKGVEGADNGGWAPFNAAALFANVTAEQVGQPVDLESGNDTNVAAPWKGDWTIVVAGDYSTVTMTTTTPKPDDNVAPVVYIRGDFTGADWAANDLWKFNAKKNDDGMWEFEFVAVGETTIPGNVSFKIADGDWGSYNYGLEGGAISLNTEQEWTNNGENAKLAADFVGKVTFVAPDANKEPIYVTFDNTDGIAETLATELEGAAEYFNLQGVRVNEPAAGLYLVRKAGKVEKVLVK